MSFMVLPTLAACGSVPTLGQNGYARQAWETAVGIHVVDQYPHEPVFTQGLVFADGYLYESTGLFGESSVRKVQLETGMELDMVRLPPELFGEGLASLGDRLYQLTWRSGVGRIYDRTSLEFAGTFAYGTEGWGLTSDGRHLIMSDGSEFLRFLDPTSFGELRRLLVHADRVPVDRLNELEFIEGHIYANIWRSDLIVKIAPADGSVVASYDLSGPMAAERRNATDIILNGIAYDAENGRTFITGKRWSKLLEIRFEPGDLPEATARPPVR